MFEITKLNQKVNINKIEKPSIVIDSETIKKNYNSLNKVIDGVCIFYSVKTNPDLNVLKYLKKLGSGFEITSLKELQIIKKIGVAPDRVISGNPIKTPEFIKAAYKYGVNYFAFDSENEIDKIAKLAPGSDVSLRILVDNTGSEWPLSKKFGASTSKALDLLNYAKEKGLNPIGLTFHVGSQCMNSLGWSNAIMQISKIFFLAKKKEINIQIINLGGGFPSKLCKEIPSVKEIKKNINKTIEENFKDHEVKFYIEPGRGIIGEAAIMVSSVIANIDRGSEKWLILDIGVYNGLLEAVAGIHYEFITEKQIAQPDKNIKLVSYNIGGPTCDSWDTIEKDYKLPKNIKVGDIVYIMNTGAYTISEATSFNGFDSPKVIFIK